MGRICRWLHGRSPPSERQRGAGGFPITGAEAQKVTHHWRAIENSIAVGARTALIDEPKLTVRRIDALSPAVVLLDPEGLIPSGLPHLSERSDVIHVCADSARSISSQHCRWNTADGIDMLLNSLHDNHGVSSMLIEGGAMVLSAFLEAGCWNEIKRWTAPSSLGSGLKAPFMPSVLGQLPSSKCSKGAAGQDRWERCLHPRHVFE